MVIYANEQEQYDVEPLKAELEQCIAAVLENHNIADEPEISVLFTDNEGIRAINAQMRDIDKPTDVLSFPQYEFETVGVVEKDPFYPYLLLGDIVLSLEKADEQAQEFGHSFKRETGYLCIHSMLHLLGYDHMNDEDKSVMRAKEKEIIQQLKLYR